MLVPAFKAANFEVRGITIQQGVYRRLQGELALLVFKSGELIF
jgi:hypothetical protein